LRRPIVPFKGHADIPLAKHGEARRTIIAGLWAYPLFQAHSERIHAALLRATGYRPHTQAGSTVGPHPAEDKPPSANSSSTEAVKAA